MSEPLSKRQIRNIMRAEHKSSGITKINPGLYRALNQYLQRMNEAYLTAHAENKTQKALTLTKEIRDTERDISTIYELRERKILLMAQDIVRGGAPSLKYLFPEEKLLLLRLSSILLQTRKDITIDFHDQVDSYIRTISREYDLERKLFEPFHPTAPFCEDPDNPPLAQESSMNISVPSGNNGNAIEGKENGNAVSATPPTPPLQEEFEKSETSSSITPAVIKATIPTDIELDEVGNMGDAPETQAKTIEVKKEEYERIPDVEGKGGPATTDLKGNINSEKDLEIDESEDDDDEETKDILRDYAITGTIGSIPQFRASDLHDYRFEPGEIITLPVKMAELLEKQKKLFIINVRKESSSN